MKTLKWTKDEVIRMISDAIAKSSSRKEVYDKLGGKNCTMPRSLKNACKEYGIDYKAMIDAKFGKCIHIDWSNYDAAKTEMLKFDNRTDFQRKHPYAYDKIKELFPNLIEEVFGENNHEAYTSDRLLLIMSNYKSFSEFRENEPQAFQVCQRRFKGLAENHFGQRSKTRAYTIEEAREIALTYRDRKDFYENDSRYTQIQKRYPHLLDELFGEVTVWTEESFKAVASEYKCREALKFYNPAAWSVGHRKFKHIMNELYGEATKGVLKHTEDHVRSVMESCENFSEFRKVYRYTEYNKMIKHYPHLKKEIFGI